MELPQSFMPDESVRAMYAAARDKQAQRAAIMQQRLAQQQAALDEQRMVKQAEIDQVVNDLSDEEKQFPAVMHDLARERALIDLDYKRRSAGVYVSGMQAGDAERAMKIEEESLQPLKEMAKPFDETNQYKTAKENWSNLSNLNKRVNGMVAEINKSKELLDKGDRHAALQNLKTFTVKQINSVPSDDAIGNMEVLFKYSPLMGAPETAMFGGKKITNPSVWFNKYREAKTQQEKEGVKKGLFETINQMMDADPEGFLETAINGSNGHIDSYNRQLREQVINTTSPGVARRMGAVPMEYIPEMKRKQKEQPVSSLATPNPFGQTVSGGAGASVPVAAQPQQTNTLNAPIGGSTIFRIKQ